MASMMEHLNTSSLLVTDHPYLPLGVEIASYLANEWSVPTLLGIFAALWVVVIVGTKTIVNRVNPNLPACEKASIWWLVLCIYPLLRSIDQLIEQFVLFTNFWISSRGNPSVLWRYANQIVDTWEAQLTKNQDTSHWTISKWDQHKIYSGNCGKNTPYQIRDTWLPTHSCCAWKPSPQYVPMVPPTSPTFLQKELLPNLTFSARWQFTWGPLCFVVSACILTNHALRHPLQIIVCVGQIYGLILYYATSMFDHYYKEVTYSRPEFLYFWGYYFFMNFIWMVFPGSKYPRDLVDGVRVLRLIYILPSFAGEQCPHDCEGVQCARETRDEDREWEDEWLCEEGELNNEGRAAISRNTGARDNASWSIFIGYPLLQGRFASILFFH